jgi:preprotein translocase subunit SecG
VSWAIEKEKMEQVILIIHVLAALGIVGLILIQQGKGADMGASFGAGGSQTLFGTGGGGNVLTKTTAVLATIFFATSFGLAVVAKEKADMSGGLDAGLPAVVETPAVPSLSDVPEIDGAATSGEVVPGASDIPTVDPVTEEADDSGIPE